MTEFEKLELERLADELQASNRIDTASEHREFADRIRALAARIPEAPSGGDGWLPIESAPRDGTRILAWNAVTGAYSTEYLDGQWPLRLWGGMKGDWYCVPTNWMPLPAPPKEGGE